MKNTDWTTEDEIDFIEGIGAWAESSSVKIRSRLGLLNRYRKGLKLREIWCDIDPKEVNKFIEEEIIKEVAKNEL